MKRGKNDFESLFAQEVQAKLKQIFEKKEKNKKWKSFIQKIIPQVAPEHRRNLEQLIQSKGIHKDQYPGEFEEFLNSTEMQVTLLLARLKALEKIFVTLQPEVKEKLKILQEELTTEVIVKEWFAYKFGRMSSSDFYDLLENGD